MKASTKKPAKAAAFEKAHGLGMAAGLRLAAQMVRAVSPYAHMGLLVEMENEALSLEKRWERETI